MVRWNLAVYMRRKTWTNAHQLATAAGLNVQTAYNVLAADAEGRALQRIDIPTLETLASAFGVKPWKLLDWGGE